MRGVLTAVTLAVGLALALFAPSVHATTLGFNGTYVVGDTTLIIEPINADGIRYYTPEKLTKLWKVRDCKEFSYVTACLQSATNTSATFSEEFIGADLRQRTTLTPSSMTLGERATGQVALTNGNALPATRVQVRLSISGPATFADRTTQQTYDGTVNEAWNIPFSIIGTAPGIAKVSGVVTYFDQNQTQTLYLDNRTVTNTVPYTIDLVYNNTTTADKTQLRVTLTRKGSEELEATITAKLPPEAEIGEVDRRVSIQGKNLVRRSTLVNDSKFNLTAEFSLRSAPTAPLTIQYEYTLGNASKETYATTHPFVSFEDSEPSLGVRIDPTTAFEPAPVRVIITGNVTGVLEITGEYLTTVEIAGPGTYDFTTKPAPEGNYTLRLNYSWTSVYGDEKSLAGKAVLEVRGKREDNWTVVDSEATEPNAPEQPPTVKLITEEDRQGADWLLWIIGGVGAGCLAGLAYVLHQMRTPMHRIESLLQKVALIHRVQAEKKGQLSPEKQAQLATLEAELAELKRRL